MLTLQKGACEHCARNYHYALLNADFGDFSYAYCDSCGIPATINLNSSFLLTMPRPAATHQVIDPAWEPFLRPCICGGHFRNGAAPRCPSCNQPLSADFAATHIEHNTIGAPRGWKWQRNWTDAYCLAMEDPQNPGNLREILNPFLNRDEEKTRKSRWFNLFG
ncbi:MAG TPA: hypothetical protein VK716_03040 [Terracidiphilus sp.]|jgi:hypothetical protein|nr:hypothetical protein [Terracidiphilus sp.]